ncbi:AfsA-related hotdog domain-containing protein, partial [Streptomyces mirabilis]
MTAGPSAWPPPCWSIPCSASAPAAGRTSAAETLRQTGIYLAHAELGIPLGHHFLMHNRHLT